MTNKILIIEDNPHNIKLLASVLNKDIYSLAIAQNGQDGLELVEEEDFDLILLDIMMPEMDGYEVCRKIKNESRQPGIPIIFLTAKTQTEDLIKGFEYGAVDYITKPFNNKELLARVKTHVELKKSREIIEQQKSELDESLTTQRKLNSIIAHDLRSPLSGIKMIIEALQYTEFSGKEFNRMLGNLLQVTKETSLLLENLLLWSRSQLGTIKPQKEKISVQDVFDHVLNLTNSQASKKNIILEMHAQEDLQLYADEDMVNTIVRNLTMNAIKFTGKGGKIELNARQNNGKAEIEVKDNGIGMDEETRNKILDKNSSITTFGTSNEKGTGLGLKVCHDFVKMHEGEIRVDSQKGEGSTFTVTF
jgi:two-component system sensor histidine kinase/response regulator